MGAPLNLVGRTFGRWTVLFDAGHIGRVRVWLCRCSCAAATEKKLSTSTLNSGATGSCGCLRREVSSARSRTHGETVGGFSPEYLAWVSMRDRCTNEANGSYANYGGRGIRVCAEWNASFETFLAYVGRKPTSKHSLDRYPDVNGNYEPGNVRWATSVEQARNRRSNVYITVGDETMLMSDWSARGGIPVSLIITRIRRLGWDHARAATEPIGTTKRGSKKKSPPPVDNTGGNDADENWVPS